MKDSEKAGEDELSTSVQTRDELGLRLCRFHSRERDMWDDPEVLGAFRLRFQVCWDSVTEGRDKGIPVKARR